MKLFEKAVNRAIEEAKEDQYVVSVSAWEELQNRLWKLENPPPYKYGDEIKGIGKVVDVEFQEDIYDDHTQRVYHLLVAMESVRGYIITVDTGCEIKKYDIYKIKYEQERIEKEEKKRLKKECKNKK